MKRERIIGEIFDYDVVKKRYSAYGGEGTTLREYRAKTVNGVDLPLDSPNGATHMVSLAPFADEDPNHFLMFTFIESRDETGFGDLDHGNAVVLAEHDYVPDPNPPEITPLPCGDGSMLKKYQLPPGAKMIGE